MPAPPLLTMSPFRTSLLAILLLPLVFSARAEDTPATRLLQERLPLFAYDRQASLGLDEKTVSDRGGVRVHDVSFVAVPGSPEGRITAFIVTPGSQLKRPCAGILWVHWLGNPATTNRTEFLEEAVALGRQGVVSLLVDAMWSKPEWYRSRVLEEDYANSIRQVVALCRALDFLRSFPDVDQARIGFVAHDYGAMYGTIAAAVHSGVRTCVWITPTASLTDWAFFVKKPASMEAYLKQNRVLELGDYLRATSGASTLTQFAGHDEYVTHERAAAFFAAANEPKQTHTYETAGHEMTAPVDIRMDRTAWLVKELGLGPN
jgi:cephalosporin-C deacetylase-like acetyl esterase